MSVEKHFLAQEKMFNDMVVKIENKLLMTARDLPFVFFAGFFCGVCCILLVFLACKLYQV